MTLKPILIVVSVVLFVLSALSVSLGGAIALLPLGLAVFASSFLVR